MWNSYRQNPDDDGFEEYIVPAGAWDECECEQTPCPECHGTKIKYPVCHQCSVTCYPGDKMYISIKLAESLCQNCYFSRINYDAGLNRNPARSLSEYKPFPFHLPLLRKNCLCGSCYCTCEECHQVGKCICVECYNECPEIERSRNRFDKLTRILDLRRNPESNFVIEQLDPRNKRLARTILAADLDDVALKLRQHELTWDGNLVTVWRNIEDTSHLRRLGYEKPQRGYLSMDERFELQEKIRNLRARKRY